MGQLYTALLAMWHWADRGISTAIPRRLQTRLAAAMVPLAVGMVVIGLVGLGVRVGSDTTATRVAVGGLQTRLASAAALPPIATKPAASSTTAAPPPPVLQPASPAVRGALPAGKGMWMYQPKAVEGGNAQAIIARAKAVGLTHIFVRTGSSKTGFYAGDFLAQILPVAHEHGVRIYGWDFPYLDNIQDDINRAVAAITFTAPGGHRIDGFSSDIEFPSMGVKVTPANALAYGHGLRDAVGTQYPLIATVPRPSHKIKFYPYPEVVSAFDAIAPMVYWLNREPVSDVTGALRDLAKFGKPVIPIGQAYDGAADHGPPGVPNRFAIHSFMRAAEEHGAMSVSFWSWQHASQEAWDAIKDAVEFTLPVTPDAVFTPAEVRQYQHMLTSLGFPTAIDGVWGPAVIDAITAYQRAANLPVTGVIDAATKKLLLHPILAPLLGR